MVDGIRVEDFSVSDDEVLDVGGALESEAGVTSALTPKRFMRHKGGLSCEFIYLRLPFDYLRRVGSPRAWAMATFLWHEALRVNRFTIRVPGYARLSDLGLGRDKAHAAIGDLEKAGLLQVLKRDQGGTVVRLIPVFEDA